MNILYFLETRGARWGDGMRQVEQYEEGWSPSSRHTPLRERAIRHLRRLILSGELAPGDRINEIELARSIGISKTPFREAMLALARDGLVKTIPFRGNFVQWLDPDHVRHIHDARVVIETAVVRQVVAHLDERDFAELMTRIDAIARAVSTGDYAAAAAEDMAFHSMLYERSGQPILLEMWELIKWQVRFVLVHDIRLRSRQGIAQPERRHRAILEALRTRDPDAAAAAIAAHIQWDGLLRLPEQRAQQQEGQLVEPPTNSGKGAS